MDWTCGDCDIDFQGVLPDGAIIMPATRWWLITDEEEATGMIGPDPDSVGVQIVCSFCVVLRAVEHLNGGTPLSRKS